LKDGGAVGGEDARGNSYVMVEARVGEDFEAGADGTALGIFGTVNEARDAGLDDGAGAHAAGLDGDVERGVGETVVGEPSGGFAKDDDFGVGGGVVVTNGAVAGTCEDSIVVNEHGADRNFTGISRSTSFGESELHEMKIVGHQRHEDNMGKGEFRRSEGRQFDEERAPAMWELAPLFLRR
jgi:hypothetical protein